jgi:hypothetical protein
MTDDRGRKTVEIGRKAGKAGKARKERRKKGGEAMRCPKCRYISFDYNQVCPRCNNDVSVQKEMLNLPDYIPDPPFLLGALIEEAADYKADIQEDYSVDVDAFDSEIDLSLDGLEHIAFDEPEFDRAEKITLIIDKKKGQITSNEVEVSE